MDEILERTIQLGCLLRDSPEGLSWRKSLERMSTLPLRTAALASLSLEKVPIVENVGLIQRANKARPLLLPLLVAKFSPHVSYSTIRHELNKNRQISEPYQQIELCTAFTGIVVTFLRTIAPGYPHSDLIYTSPNTMWTEISSYKELPWNLAASLIPENARDAKQLGLERVIPTSGPLVIGSLNLLVEAIRQSAIWKELDKANKVIERQNNLKIELYRARKQFNKEFARYRDISVSKVTQFTKFEDLARQVYAKRGKRIKGYINAFLEYERLIERIYWILSQLIIFESISCITSSLPQQLQQVSLNYGKEAFITALAKTRGKTLAVGQMVHVALSETDHISDGLYQVDSLRQKFEPRSGVHVLFRARKLWYCQLDGILSVTRNYKPQTCLQNEMPDILSETKISITDGDKVIETLELGGFLNYKFSDTMYLP